MGTEVYGWVEVYTPVVSSHPEWTAVVRINDIVERNYGMFGSLFGVRNDYGFPPVAAERGLPKDVSSQLIEFGEVLYPPQSHGAHDSWITGRELKNIDWQEFGTSPEPGVPPGPLRRRAEVVTPGWRTVLDIIELLTRQFGDDGVRLVVWFA